MKKLPQFVAVAFLVVSGSTMRKLLISIMTVAMLIGFASVAKADAAADFAKGVKANQTGNYAQSVQWYRKAAEQGFADAQYNLGVAYTDGQGVTQDYTGSVRLSIRAAQDEGALLRRQSTGSPR